MRHLPWCEINTPNFFLLKGESSILIIKVQSILSVPDKKLIVIGVLYSVELDENGYTVFLNDPKENPFLISSDSSNRHESRVIYRADTKFFFFT